MLRSKKIINIKAEDPVMDIAQEVCGRLNKAADGHGVRFSLHRKLFPKKATLRFYDCPGRHAFGDPSHEIYHVEARRRSRWSFDIIINTSAGLSRDAMAGFLCQDIRRLLSEYGLVPV